MSNWVYSLLQLYWIVSKSEVELGDLDVLSIPFIQMEAATVNAAFTQPSFCLNYGVHPRACFNVMASQTYEDLPNRKPWITLDCHP